MSAQKLFELKSFIVECCEDYSFLNFENDLNEGDYSDLKKREKAEAIQFYNFFNIALNCPDLPAETVDYLFQINLFMKNIMNSVTGAGRSITNAEDKR